VEEKAKRDAFAEAEKEAVEEGLAELEAQFLERAKESILRRKQQEKQEQGEKEGGQKVAGAATATSVQNKAKTPSSTTTTTTTAPKVMTRREQEAAVRGAAKEAGEAAAEKAKANAATIKNLFPWNAKQEQQQQLLLPSSAKTATVTAARPHQHRTHSLTWDEFNEYIVLGMLELKEEQELSPFSEEERKEIFYSVVAKGADGRLSQPRVCEE
jgi:hypothetical protein